MKGWRHLYSNYLTFDISVSAGSSPQHKQTTLMVDSPLDYCNVKKLSIKEGEASSNLQLFGTKCSKSRGENLQLPGPERCSRWQERKILKLSHFLRGEEPFCWESIGGIWRRVDAVQMWECGGVMMERRCLRRCVRSTLAELLRRSVSVFVLL